MAWSSRLSTIGSLAVREIAVDMEASTAAGAKVTRASSRALSPAAVSGLARGLWKGCAGSAGDVGEVIRGGGGGTSRSISCVEVPASRMLSRCAMVYGGPCGPVARGEARTGRGAWGDCGARGKRGLLGLTVIVSYTRDVEVPDPKSQGGEGLQEGSAPEGRPGKKCPALSLGFVGIRDFGGTGSRLGGGAGGGGCAAHAAHAPFRLF